ncbi:MAG: arcA [Myxococcaceae bacterium]|nr:arcA [Myxococcaceae bacterium]
MLNLSRIGRRTLIVPASCALLLWSGCESSSQGGARTAHAAAPEVRRVQIEKIRQVDVREHVSATGTLRPQEQVLVKAEVAGRLASVAVDLGTEVKCGQVIASIDPADLRLRVAQAVAALNQARALLGLSPDGLADAARVDVEQTSAVRQARATHEEAAGQLERSPALFARKMIGPADLDAATAALLRSESALGSAREEIYNRQAVLKQRQAELALAQRALAYTQVTSPIDGVVQAKHLSGGELVAPGTSIASIVDVEPLRLRLEIPERAVSKVRLGDSVRVLPDEEQAYEGRVLRIAPMVDEQNRTLSIEAEVPSHGVLRAGSFVRAEIELGQSARVLMVPTRSVVVFAGLEKVLRVVDGKAVESVVKTGRTEGGLTEIRSGLLEDAWVIVDPNSLATGDLVEVSQEHSRAEAR